MAQEKHERVLKDMENMKNKMTENKFKIKFLEQALDEKKKENKENLDALRWVTRLMKNSFDFRCIALKRASCTNEEGISQKRRKAES